MLDKEPILILTLHRILLQKGFTVMLEAWPIGGWGSHDHPAMAQAIEKKLIVIFRASPLSSTTLKFLNDTILDVKLDCFLCEEGSDRPDIRMKLLQSIVNDLVEKDIVRVTNLYFSDGKLDLQLTLKDRSYRLMLYDESVHRYWNLDVKY